jgi:hypothetical protein
METISSSCDLDFGLEAGEIERRSWHDGQRTGRSIDREVTV